MVCYDDPTHDSRGNDMEPELEKDSAPAEAEDSTVEETPLVEDEQLVEEISIDGMCGVY